MLVCVVFVFAYARAPVCLCWGGGRGSVGGCVYVGGCDLTHFETEKNTHLKVDKIFKDLS